MVQARVQIKARASLSFTLKENSVAQKYAAITWCVGPRRSYGSCPFILRGGYVYQSMSSFSQISTYAFKLQNLAFHSFCCVSRNYYIHIHRYDHLRVTYYRLGLVLEQKNRIPSRERVRPHKTGSTGRSVYSGLLVY